METRSQNPMPDAMSAANSINPSDLASLDSTGNPNGGDWQEEVYQKIKAMKDLYLLDLNDMHQKILGKLQQHDSFPQQPKDEQLEKLKVFKNMLERFMQFLQIPKHGILANYKDKLGTYERQIVHIINSNRMATRKRNLTYSGDEVMQESKKMAVRFEEKMYTAATSQSVHIKSDIALKIQTVPIKSENSNSAAYGSNLSYPASLETSQTGNLNNGDWQEEVYQKIKAMKDLYLLDLNSLHQKILGKLQQHDSFPQQLKDGQLEKLKVFKNMLERYMQFLQISKHGILANYKDKLVTYEMQIVNIINSIRRKPAPTQQQQALPPPHMHSMQQSQQSLSQLTQVPSHDNQMNLSGSMASMQPNNMGSLQQNFSQMNLQGSMASIQNILHIEK